MNIIDAITEMHFAKPVEGTKWAISNPYLFKERHVYLTNTNHNDVLRMNFFAASDYIIGGDPNPSNETFATIKHCNLMETALKTAYCPARNELLRQDWFLVSVDEHS